MISSHTTSQRFKGWEKYPQDPGESLTLASGSAMLCNQLTKQAPVICSGHVDIRLLDFDEDGTLLSQTAAYERAADVERQLLKSEGQRPRLRIISLHSNESPQPLEISEPLLRKILVFHQIDSVFLNVLFSFGSAPNTSESGSSNIATLLKADGSHIISYQLRYIEENHRTKTQPFSPRQTGIYHVQSHVPDFDLFIILNPIEDSLLESQLLRISQSKASVSDLGKNPYQIHLLPFSLYIDNWRWYLRYIGRQLEKMNDKIMTVELDTSASVSLNFDKVQTLHNLEDYTLSSNGYCKSAIAVLKMLDANPKANFTEDSPLGPILSRLNGYNESLPALTARIRNSIQLHAYALDLKNQYTAATTNDHISTLAEETTRDTTAVKWITYLTLIYLPGTFVATLYGMNLFLFNPESRRLAIAQNFWIFVATWLPLTILTYIAYLFMIAHRKPESKGSRDAAYNMPEKTNEP